MSIDSPELILVAGSVVSIVESPFILPSEFISPLPNEFISPFKSNEDDGKFWLHE